MSCATREAHELRSDKPVAPNRDPRGRFTRGNPGGPGNPFARKTALLRSVAIQCLSTADMQVIVERLIYFAREGHIPAIKLLFQYTLGKPIEGQHPDEVDFDESDDQEPPATVDALCDMLRRIEKETEDRKLKDEQRREKRALTRLARNRSKQASPPPGVTSTVDACREMPGVAPERPSRTPPPSPNGEHRRDAYRSRSPRPAQNPSETMPAGASSHGRQSLPPQAMPPSPNGEKRSESNDPADAIYARVRQDLHESLLERFGQIFASWEEHHGCTHDPDDPASAGEVDDLRRANPRRRLR
ncbi:MAG: hypothetical protein ACKO23_16205 [Gemmataceae bacterium]